MWTSIGDVEEKTGLPYKAIWSMCSKGQLVARKTDGRNGRRGLWEIDLERSKESIDRKKDKYSRMRSHKDGNEVTIPSTTSAIVKVKQSDLPLETLSGVVWTVPIAKEVGTNEQEDRLICNENCGYFHRCKIAVRSDGFIACEQPLQRELFDNI